MGKKLFSVVVPLYNEEDVIDESYRRLKKSLDSIEYVDHEIIFVNDGSRDKTVELVKEICDKDKKVKLISFSRNFGQQMAVTAGLDFAKGDYIGFIDADLQDPPEMLAEMLNKIANEGYNVAYGTRPKRKGETFFKKFTSMAFYRVMNMMSEVEVPVDTGDFRVIDKSVADVVRSMREKDRFMRGLVSWAGFKQIGMEFHRDERFAGETKYSIKKLTQLSLDAIISFSSTPLKLSQFIGFIGFLIGLAFAITGVIFKTFSIPIDFNGLILLFIGSFNLICLGIIGEYVGRIYNEVKGRPLYVIKEIINF